MKILIKIGSILALLYASLPADIAQDVTKATKSHTESEIYKAIERKLADALFDEHNSQAVSNGMKKIWDATKNLSAAEKKEVLRRIANQTKESLKATISLSQNSLKDYVRTAASKVNIDNATLKNIVGGAGDAAGNSALKALNSVDEMVRNGKLTKAAVKLLRDQASGLGDPKRARAFLEIIRKKAETDWAHTLSSKGLGELLGTAVDGAFVLHDTINIYYIDDPEEKAIQATGKIVEYTSYTAGTVGAGMVQGATTTVMGGFLPGIIVTFTAAQLGTLTMEIIRLKQDQANAKSAQEASRLGLWILAREQLIKINGYIKAGEYTQARTILTKTRHYLQKREELWLDKDLTALYTEVSNNLEKAQKLESLNRVINEARFPYMKALNLYRDKHSLIEARSYAQEALKIFETSIYPELLASKSYQYTKDLLNAINQEIANASEIKIVSISGPKRLQAGEFGTYSVSMQGGIPYYHAVSPNGYGSKTDVTLYWEAPKKEGKTKVSFTLRDDIGQTKTASVVVDVVVSEEPVAKTEGALKLIGYTTVHSLSGKMVKNELGMEVAKSAQVETREVYAGTDMNFLVNVQNNDYKYLWKVNGTQEKDPNWKWGYSLRTADEAYAPYGIVGIGRYTVEVEVYNENNVLIGSDGWIFAVKKIPQGNYVPSGVIPEGD